MAITEFQRKVCNLIAENRKKHGVSYVAGGVALNYIINAPRISQDIDIFNDSTKAVQEGFELDKSILSNHNYNLDLIRERSTFIEASISDDDNAVLMQWTCDSSFRFFPLVEDEELGLMLHPFDLATNKVLALVGRLEIRDWIDIINCSDRIQHLGLLAWAACGKDPGFSPLMIINEAARSSHYSQQEYDMLEFENNKSDDLSMLLKKWKIILVEAKNIITQLPVEQIGKCIMNRNSDLYKVGDDFKIIQDTLSFHDGSLQGSYPSILNDFKLLF